MQIYEIEMIALHEAGHAVIARALGIPVESVSIQTLPPKTRYGRERSPEEGVWTTMAGRMVILEFTRSSELADYGASGDDDATVVFLKRFATDSEREQVMKVVETQLPALIRANTEAIWNVSEQLVKTGVVIEAELESLLSDLLSPRSKVSFFARVRKWFSCLLS